MVHRPFRLAEILVQLVAYHHLEPKRMQLVYPLCGPGAEHGAHRRPCAEANPRMTVEKPLIVYDRAGCL